MRYPIIDDPNNDPIIPLKPQPARLTDEDIEAAIGTMEQAGLLIVRRDNTGHVRWFTLATGTYADDELRKDTP